MTRILRNFRQQLSGNNQFSRYFLFALGEIVLIILGILIALQIDNKNQEKQNLGLEKEYLLSMHEELAIDSVNLLLFIERLNNVIEKLDIILDNHKTHSQLPIDSISFLYQQIFWVPYFRNHTETFESVESSGHLSIIQNLNIKHGFFQLIKEYEALAKYYDNQFLSFSIEINKNAANYFALDKMSFIDEKYAYSQDAINNIVMSRLIRESLIGHAKPCYRKVERLLDNIETELEARFNE